MLPWGRTGNCGWRAFFLDPDRHGADQQPDLQLARQGRKARQARMLFLKRKDFLEGRHAPCWVRSGWCFPASARIPAPPLAAFRISASAASRLGTTRAPPSSAPGRPSVSGSCGDFSTGGFQLAGAIQGVKLVAAPTCSPLMKICGTEGAAAGPGAHILAQLAVAHHVDFVRWRRAVQQFPR